MAEAKKTEIDIIWQQVSIVERFSTVLYPLNIPFLLGQLPNLGYIVPELVLRGTPEQGKPVATKGNTELVINSDNKVIGVKGNDPEKVVTEFQELKAFYLERLDPSPIDVDYVEFDGAGWIKSKDNPLKVFSRFWREAKALQKLGSVIDEQVINYGLELVPNEQDPNSPKWFHIIIQPFFFSGSKQYSVRWIWREPKEVERFLKKCAKTNETLRVLVSTIEAR